MPTKRLSCLIWRLRPKSWLRPKIKLLRLWQRRINLRVPSLFLDQHVIPGSRSGFLKVVSWALVVGETHHVWGGAGIKVMLLLLLLLLMMMMMMMMMMIRSAAGDVSCWDCFCYRFGFSCCCCCCRFCWL